MINLPNINFEV